MAGVWSDESAALEGHIGIDCNLSMDSWDGASFVWSEFNGGNYDVWLANSAIINSIDSTPPIRLVLRAHPNPFNPSTAIHFQLQEAAEVTLHLYNATGRRVRNLVEGGVFPAGEAQVYWDGRMTKVDGYLAAPISSEWRHLGWSGFCKWFC